MGGGLQPPAVRQPVARYNARAPVASPAWNSLASDPAAEAFLERCQLDATALELLEPLPQELQVKVMNEFDPSGTKDGNVLGRLEGYVRCLSQRKGIAQAGGRR